MSRFRPTPTEERWSALAAALGRSSTDQFFAQRSGGWRRSALATRCALFVLGLVAAAMGYVVLSLLHLPDALACAGAAEIALAEWLILRRRLYGSGIEEALELAGLLLIGYDLLTHGVIFAHLRTSGMIAAACAVAGLRMLNPLFTSVAAVAGVAAIVFEAGAAWPYPEQGPDRVASLLCNLVAVAALTGGAWTFRRPSHDRMLGWLVVLMPVAGYLWSAGLPGMHATPDYLHDHSLSALYTPLAPLAFAALALLTGLRRRSHAPLLACMLCIACVAYELRGLTGWPYQVRLIVWGTALLGATVLLERALRRPRRGITTSRLDADRATADLLQLAGAAALAPPAQASPSASFRGGGGEFGGGGASGRY